jgi:hypothetical protein
MHRPGYVQGGQEAKCGYLLLGIYYRRIPGDILTQHFILTQKKIVILGSYRGHRLYLFRMNSTLSSLLAKHFKIFLVHTSMNELTGNPQKNPIQRGS